jgi:uridine kinase/ribulose-5-phosphate 4-epimerase/fuculose-1-phosphate aldolase
MKPHFIGIAGDSGVGKTTIAEIVEMFYTSPNVLRISTDDLHKWDRNDDNWKSFTHLNPSANNLELGDIHLEALKHNQPIWRSTYNHKNGVFNPPIKLHPKQYIIVDGLHAFFTDISKKIIDLKIYVDTDKELKIHWKLIRDTEDRGHTYNDVLDAIRRRKDDSDFISKSQIEDADVIVKIQNSHKIKLLGNKDETIKLHVEFVYNKQVNGELFDFISKYFNLFNNFIEGCDTVGNDILLSQGACGNISVKLNDSIMFIKASGYALKNVSKLKGYAFINYEKIINEFKNGNITHDSDLNNILKESLLIHKLKLPSMETGFHSILGKWVIHTHPVYLNTILCTVDSSNIIGEIFSDIDYIYINYKNPGFGVCNAINKRLTGKSLPHVIFLENHGLIVSTTDHQKAGDITNHIDQTAKRYLKKKCSTFTEFDLSFADTKPVNVYSYPDSVVFVGNETTKNREVVAIHNYINLYGNKISTIRPLDDESIEYIKNMETEKYRKKL